MPHRAAVLLLVLGCCLGLAACAPAAPAAPEMEPPNYWPTEAWRSAPLQDHGLDPELPAAVDAFVRERLPFLDALLIVRHGYLVHESYYNGHDATSLHDVASVTKSWTSALVGMARVQGHLPDVDATLPDLLPDSFAGGAHADKRAITLRHLLTMRSGIDFSEDALNTGVYGGPELLEGDLTELALGFPMAYTPGETWNYSTLDTQLVSAVVEQAVGQPLAEFAEAGLFAALGVGPVDWWADATGTTLGGQNLSMTARDAAKLGLLYLHGGRWEGAQLLPSAWVWESLTPQGAAYYPPTGQDEVIDWYGYLWWLWKGEWFYGYRSFQAKGYGGQQVLVFPELDLILVTLANGEGVTPDVDVEQASAINDFFLELVLPGLTDVTLVR